MNSVLNLLGYVWRHPLNAGGRMAALRRVVRWQMAARLMPGPIAVPFVQETSLLMSRGMTGATGNWYCGLHEVSEMGFVLHLLRPGDHFLDVGANVGSYTVLAGGAAGARVTAVEPVPATRLDDLLGQDVPILIRMDVEGHERAVMRGGQATLADRRLLAVIMETNGSGRRYGVSDAELLDLMGVHRFFAAWLRPVQAFLDCRHGRQREHGFRPGHGHGGGRLGSAPVFRLVNGEI